jgi:hypothetical protein
MVTGLGKEEDDREFLKVSTAFDVEGGGPSVLDREAPMQELREPQSNMLPSPLNCMNDADLLRGKNIVD